MDFTRYNFNTTLLVKYNTIIDRGTYGIAYHAHIAPKFVFLCDPGFEISSAPTLLKQHSLLYAYVFMHPSTIWHISYNQEPQHCTRNFPHAELLLFGKEIENKILLHQHLPSNLFPQNPNVSVVIKMIAKHNTRDHCAREITMLQHVGLYIADGQSTNNYYIVMRKVLGQSLYAFCDLTPQPPLLTKKHIALCAAQALCELQKKHIIHRDISIKNLLIDRKPENTMNVTIIDYDMARHHPTPSLPTDEDALSDTSDSSTIFGDFCADSPRGNFYTAPELSDQPRLLMVKPSVDLNLRKKQDFITGLLETLNSLFILQHDILWYIDAHMKRSLINANTNAQCKDFLEELQNLPITPYSRYKKLSTELLSKIRILSRQDFLPKIHPRTDVYSLAVAISGKTATPRYYHTINNPLFMQQSSRPLLDTKFHFGLKLLDDPRLTPIEHEHLTALTTKCLSRQPEHRPSSKTFLQALQDIFQLRLIVNSDGYCSIQSPPPPPPPILDSADDKTKETIDTPTAPPI